MIAEFIKSASLPEQFPADGLPEVAFLGRSNVGKSSLIRAIQPQLDLRIGAISGYTGKGRHTTTSARHYNLDFGGAVIDTPGVKQFGLWGVTKENLIDFFPDVANDAAPKWRVESYQRILSSLSSEAAGAAATGCFFFLSFWVLSSPKRATGARVAAATSDS